MGDSDSKGQVKAVQLYKAVQKAVQVQKGGPSCLLKFKLKEPTPFRGAPM